MDEESPSIDDEAADSLESNEEVAEAAPTAETPSATNADPAHLGRFVESLSPNDQDRVGKAVASLGMVLEEGEEVRGAIAGRYLGHDGILALTSSRVIAINGRRYLADWAEQALDTDLAVKGWAEAGKATLRIGEGETAHVVDEIADIQRARDFADAVRAARSS